VRGQALDPLWTETLAIALAHYFTTRRFVDLSPELIARLKSEGLLAEEPTPLYLPGFTIRALIILGFLGLALFLQKHGRLGDPQSLAVLGLVGSYLLGVVSQVVRSRLFRGRHPWFQRGWEDVKASATVLAVGVTFAAYLAGFDHDLHPLWRDATLGLVLFYFGSR
jgi:hypothetical protein